MHSFGSGIMWHDDTSPKSYTVRLWDFWVNTCERWVSSLCNMNEYHWKTQWISSFNSIFWHHITYDSRKMLRIWPNGVLFFASALPKLAMLWMGKGWHPLVKQHSWLEHVVAKMKSLVVFQLAGKLLDHRQKGQGCMQHDSIRGTNPTNGSSVSLWHRCSLVPGGPKTEAMYFHIKVTRCSVHTAFWSPSNKLWHQDTHKHTHKRKINAKQKKTCFPKTIYCSCRTTVRPDLLPLLMLKDLRPRPNEPPGVGSWNYSSVIAMEYGIWFPPQKIICPPPKKTTTWLAGKSTSRMKMYFLLKMNMF